MIKAETITHEAEAAPNWLDRCRSAVTPGRALPVLVLVAAIAVIGITSGNDQTTLDDLPASSHSQQATTSQNSLDVLPLNQLTTSASGGTATVQSAAGGQQAADKTTTADPATNGLGASATPNFNADTGSQNNTPQQPQLGQKLTNTVQTVIPDLSQTTSKLGL